MLAISATNANIVTVTYRGTVGSTSIGTTPGQWAAANGIFDGESAAVTLTYDTSAFVTVNYGNGSVGYIGNIVNAATLKIDVGPSMFTADNPLFIVELTGVNLYFLQT